MIWSLELGASLEFGTCPRAVALAKAGNLELSPEYPRDQFKKFLQLRVDPRNGNLFPLLGPRFERRFSPGG
jgi:hypothetical protein